MWSWSKRIMHMLGWQKHFLFISLLIKALGIIKILKHNVKMFDIHA